MQQKLLSNRTILIITTKIDPRIDDRVATCGGTLHALATPTTNVVIKYAERSSAQVNRDTGHVSRTGSDGNTPYNCDVAERSPRENGPVLIGGIVTPETIGYNGSLDVLNKQQSTPPSISSNTQYFDSSVDGNFAKDGEYTFIFRKVLSRELSNSLSADIYSCCSVDFTSNAVITEAPTFVHLGLPDANALDEFNTFGIPTTIVRRSMDSSYW